MQLILILETVRSNTTFDKVGGDAIDLSGSDVYLKDINAKNVFDKAVSAGEQSNLKINNLQSHHQDRYCK